MRGVCWGVEEVEVESLDKTIFVSNPFGFQQSWTTYVLLQQAKHSAFIWWEMLVWEIFNYLRFSGVSIGQSAWFVRVKIVFLKTASLARCFLTINNYSTA